MNCAFFCKKTRGVFSDGPEPLHHDPGALEFEANETGGNLDGAASPNPVAPISIKQARSYR